MAQLWFSVVGLDPAGPLFESQHIKARLDSTDANFVDVIHSNGENLILGGLGEFSNHFLTVNFHSQRDFSNCYQKFTFRISGSYQPMGDADFYPNGGRVQTGCSNIFVGAVTDFIWCKLHNIQSLPVHMIKISLSI